MQQWGILPHFGQRLQTAVEIARCTIMQTYLIVPVEAAQVRYAYALWGEHSLWCFLQRWHARGQMAGGGIL